MSRTAANASLKIGSLQRLARLQPIGDLTMPSTASVEEPSRMSHLAMGVVAICLVILLGAVYAYGLAARAASERIEAALIEQENRAFCTGLGLADKSEPYTRCITGLTAIRHRQRERFDAESAGIL